MQAVKRRFQINDAGMLVDREGHVLGRVTGITIDMPERGDIGGLLFDEGNEPPQGGVGGAKAAEARFLSEQISAVLTCYVEVMEPRGGMTAMGAEERRIVRDALKVATVDECCRAIRGCAASAFHMGQNERHRKYNRLTQILKGKRGGKTTREQIDMFLDIAEKAGLQSGNTSADPSRVAQAKREVLDGWEFPHDAGAVERAQRARVWLEQHGVKVETGANGRPTFRWE